MSSFVKLVLKENLFDSPFAPRSKCIGAAASSAIISAIGGLASGISSGIAAGNANARGERLAHYQMGWQSEENQKARDYATQMWNAENAYNTPLNQRRLAEEAGYNPYLLGNENLGSGAGSAGNPSMQGSPNGMDFKPVNMLGGVGQGFDAFSRLMSINQNQQQVEANVDLQKAQALQNLFSMQIEAYKVGGQNLVNQIQEEYKDVFKAYDWSGSFYEQEMNKKFLSMDIANDRADIERMILNLYGPDRAKAELNKVNKSIEVMDSEIRQLETKSDLNQGDLRRVASEIARNFAEAFNARKQGDYYEVSASQMTIMNKMFDMQEKDMEADFAYNAAVRKYKKDLTHRGDMLGLFQAGLKAQALESSMQGNKVLRYTKAITSMIGDVFKVNIGFSNNNTNFRNITPQSNQQMFYSGDGYYMNNGTLLKGNW